MEYLEDILVPIFICVVLPVLIVFIVCYRSITADKIRASVLTKAIEANADIDADKLVQAMAAPRKTDLQVLNLRLLRGGIFTLVGVALLAFGIYNYATLQPNMSTAPAALPCIFGGISAAVGISYLIVYFTTRKQVEAAAKEQPEEK